MSKGTAAGHVESFRFPRALGDWFRLRQGGGKRRFPRLFQSLDLDPRYAPAIHFHDGEAVTFKVKTLAAAGNKSELRENETSGGRVGRILRQTDVVARLKVVQAQRGVEDHRRIRALPD